MASSDFIYEEGGAIQTGFHGDTSYVYASGDPVPNAGDSTLVYESGTGLGGDNLLVTVYDSAGNELASLSGRDTTWRSGGIAWITNPGTGVAFMWYDDCRTSDGTVIDDFESGSLSAYKDPNNNFSITTDPVYQGTYALESEISAGGNEYMTSTSGLNYYPEPGDTWDEWYRWDDSMSSMGMKWAVQNQPDDGSESPDGYTLLITGPEGQIQNSVRLQGPSGLLDEAPLDTTSRIGEWVRAEHTWY